MTYTDAHTSFHALPADIRARVEARVGKPPRPMSTMEIMAAIGKEIVAERERCAEIIDARLPLYHEIGQINALRECASSIRNADTPAGDETE